MALANGDIVLLPHTLRPTVTFAPEVPLLGQVEDATGTIVAWEDGRRVDYGIDLSATNRFVIVLPSVANADLINAEVRATVDNFGQRFEGVVVRTFAIEDAVTTVVGDLLTVKTELGFITQDASLWERVAAA